MDTLTHIAIGVCTSKVYVKKQSTLVSLVVGGILQCLPDFDVVASIWTPAYKNLLVHRGFTHSVLFILLLGFVSAFLLHHYFKRISPSYSYWLFFSWLQLSIHLFIDVMNNYPIALLAPFVNTRYSLHALFVLDPIFSVFPGVAAFVILAISRVRRWHFSIALLGLILPALYLLISFVNKSSVKEIVLQNIKNNNLPMEELIITPAPFQNVLWYIIVKSANGFDIGFYSLFNKNKNIEFSHFDQNEQLLDSIKDHEEVQYLMNFADGFHQVSMLGDTLLFNDVRFGQINGWTDTRGRFVFHYFLSHNLDNRLVMQRGRFKDWDRYRFKSYFIKMTGY